MGQILVREYTHACVLWDVRVVLHAFHYGVGTLADGYHEHEKGEREKNGKEREVQEHLVEEAVDAVVHDRAEG